MGFNDGGKCMDQVCGGRDLSMHKFRIGKGARGRERKERRGKKKENKSELHAIYITIRKNGYCKTKCSASLSHCDVLVRN